MVALCRRIEKILRNAQNNLKMRETGWIMTTQPAELRQNGLSQFIPLIR